MNTEKSPYRETHQCRVPLLCDERIRPTPDNTEKTSSGTRISYAAVLLAGALLFVGSTGAQSVVPLDSVARWASHLTSYTNSIAWGDVDGDGDLDLACGNGSGTSPGRNAARVYINNHGTLEALATWYSQEEDTTQSVAWADVDGDGDLDLACGNLLGPNRVYFNYDGVLEPAAGWSSSELDATRTVAWGDVNGDGLPDLACGNESQPNRVYINQGGTLERTAGWMSGESDQTCCVAWGDIDGNGTIDLVAGNFDQPIRVYYNLDTVLENAASWSSSLGHATQSVCLGDINADGLPDLACGNLNEGNTVFLNLNDTLETEPSWVSQDARFTRSVALGDVNGDGLLDLACGNDRSENAIYLNSQGNLGQTASWRSDDTTATYAVAWGDVDGDGDLELASGNANGANRVYHNWGYVLDSVYGWTSVPDASTESIAWGDFNHDSNLDLACGNLGDVNRVYLNSGGSLGTEAFWSSTEASSTTHLLWGDIDGGSYPDLICGNDGQANRIYRNIGGVLESDVWWQSYDQDQTISMALGDVGGDGNPDLICGNWMAPNRVYFNSGNATVPLDTVARWNSMDSGYTNSVAWGDVDGDGDLDLACGNGKRQSSANKIYFNHNGELQTAAGWTSTEADMEKTRSLAWADIDSDGDLDLACGNFDQRNSIYLNGSDGLAIEAEWKSAAANKTRSVAWGDVDGDGDLDLACGNFGQPNIIYRNLGGVLDSSACWHSGVYDNSQTTSLAWGDMDLDGDLDLACGNRGKNGVYVNNLADAWRRLTRLTNSPAYIDSIHIVDWDSTTNAITFGFTLCDRDSDPARIAVEYMAGAGGWLPAATDPGPDIPLATSVEGVYHTIIWDADSAGVDGYDVRVRFRVVSCPNHGGVIQRPAQVYQMQVGRIDGRPRISLLYPLGDSRIVDSLPLLGRFWDPTNFERFGIGLGMLPDTTAFELLLESDTSVHEPGRLATLDLGDIPEGDYVLRLSCEDANGHTTTVDRTFALSAKPPQGPTVTHYYPRQGGAGIPRNAPVVVQFDMNMNQPSINKQTFVLNSERGDQYSNVLYDYKTRTLTVLPDRLYAAGCFHYAVVSSRFPSQQGTPLGGEHVLSFRTSNAEPVDDIDSLHPALGETEIPVGTDSLCLYYKSFSSHRYVTVFSLGGDTIAVDSISDAWHPGVVPLGNLRPRDYYIVRVSDSPAFDGEADLMSYFITEDTALPFVDSISPANRRWLVGLDEPVAVVFNKEVNTFSVDSTTFVVADGTEDVPGFLDFSSFSGATVVTFTPSRPYRPETEHTVTLTSHVQDNIGNSIERFVSSFATGTFATVGYTGAIVESDVVSVYFPRGALQSDELIGVGRIPRDQLIVPPELIYSDIAFDIAPTLTLAHDAVMTITIPDSVGSIDAVSGPRLYHYDPVTEDWSFRGGSLEAGKLSVAVTKLGRYGVFADTTQPPTSSSAPNLTLTPRVISPAKGGQDAHLSVSFKLSRPSDVSARVYSSSGRLIRTLHSGHLSNIGENVLSWDGRCSSGEFVNDGLYIVVLEITGTRLQQTFVVMNR